MAVLVGKKAPDFVAPAVMPNNSINEKFQFSQHIKGKYAVLFFYPRDDAPFCTLEAIDFTDHEEEFTRASCTILGVSRDDCLSHAEFRDKHGLSVRLLADMEGEVSRKYGVCQMKEKDGVRKLCVVRSTFVIDSEGVVRHALYDIKPRGHVAEVLQLVKQLEQPCK